MAEDISVGELSRQVAQVLTRFERLATRLDESYVSRQLYELYVASANANITDLKADKVEKSELIIVTASVTAIELRVKSLENNLQWIVRLVVAFVVTAILGAVFVASGLHG